MNRIITTVVAVCAALAVSAAEWSGKVGECATNPETLKKTISTIPEEEQDDFIAAVNAAIAELPGSDEVKAAMFLNANSAAVVGASKAARVSVLAEVYATVPPEHLTLINEQFAKNLFNRNADPNNPTTDEKYLSIATGAMAKIAERCATAADGNGDVRAAFAALMFERASNGQEGIREALIATLPASARDTARNEWFPSAMGEGREQSYDQMLGTAGAGDEPERNAALNLASSANVSSSQIGLALISEIRGTDSGVSPGAVATTAPGVIGTSHNDLNVGVDLVPRAFVYSETPVGLQPIVEGGKVKTDPNGNPMYRDSKGNTLVRTRSANGEYVYHKDTANGPVVKNSYYTDSRDEPRPYDS